jgi:hypothetical protein
MKKEAPAPANGFLCARCRKWLAGKKPTVRFKGKWFCARCANKLVVEQTTR